MGNMQENFGEVRPYGIQIIRADRQIDAQTDKLQYFATLTG